MAVHQLAYLLTVDVITGYACLPSLRQRKSYNRGGIKGIGIVLNREKVLIAVCSFSITSGETAVGVRGRISLLISLSGILVTLPFFCFTWMAYSTAQALLVIGGADRSGAEIPLAGRGSNPQPRLDSPRKRDYKWTQITAYWFRLKNPGLKLDFFPMSFHRQINS